MRAPRSRPKANSTSRCWCRAAACSAGAASGSAQFGGGGDVGGREFKGGSLGSGNRRGRALLPLPDAATAHRSKRCTGAPEGRRARLWTPGARAGGQRSRGPRGLPGLTSVCPRGGSSGRRRASPRPLLRLQPGTGDGKEEGADLGRRGGWVGQHAALRCRQQLSQLGAQAGGAGLAQAAAHRRQQLACADGGSSAPCRGSWRVLQFL